MTSGKERRRRASKIGEIVTIVVPGFDTGPRPPRRDGPGLDPGPGPEPDPDPDPEPEPDPDPELHVQEEREVGVGVGVHVPKR